MPSDWLAELEAAHKAADLDALVSNHIVSPGYEHLANLTEVISENPKEGRGRFLAMMRKEWADLLALSRNRLPDLLRIARLAKAVAGESWGTCTTEEHHCERMAKMDALRAVLRGGSHER